MDETRVTVNSSANERRASGVAPYEAAFGALVGSRPGLLASEVGGELSWLRSARERDWYRWKTEGLPTPKSERWRYTKVAALGQGPIFIPTRAPSKSAALSALNGEFSAEIVFVDGLFSPSHSKLEGEAGLLVQSLSSLVKECVDNGWTADRRAALKGFREHVETSDADDETVFAAMNTSFLQDCVLISVAKGAVIRKPIVVTYLQTATRTEAGLPMVAPRVFAHLERRAEAALIERYVCDGSSGADENEVFVNAVSDIRLEEEARLSFAKVQIGSRKTWHIGTTRVHQKAGSWSENFQFTLGGRVSREDLHISLEGQGAETTLNGLYLVGKDQHADHFTSVEHVVPHTTSSQLYKGILAENGRGVFNGRVHIRKDAQKSNAAQLNQNLLLSKKAEADTKPELEIYADDVKASHGATIGQIDPEHVFYLQARAIPRQQAVSMLARGFAQDVVFSIKNEYIRAALGELVSAKFDELSFEGV